MIAYLTRMAACLQVLFTTTAETLGKTTQFVKRQRKVTASGFAQCLVFQWMARPKATLESMALELDVSPQALQQHLGPAPAAVLLPLRGSRGRIRTPQPRDERDAAGAARRLTGRARMPRSKTTAGAEAMTRAPTAGTPVSRALGENVRRLRLERGLSVVDLAARSGIARATLTQLESGRGNPTIETIAAPAAVLGAEADALLRYDPAPHVLVVRDGEGGRTSEIATLIDRHPHEAGRTEVFDFRLAGGGRERSTSHGPGSAEIVLVRSGHLRVGPLEATVELDAGDYAAFSADCLHEYVAPPGEGTRFWLVVRYGTTRSRRRR